MMIVKPWQRESDRRRLLPVAERVAGKDSGREVFELRSPLPLPNVLGMVESRAFAPFRRIGQRMLCNWYWLRDEK
ncbi:hypothetical protein [Variovorax sp. YR566]|uniref:hypothetical protein n=1 Tax=Variovorax sp. YR566 TaxID=3450237 RepID=UPI003F7ECFE6